MSKGYISALAVAASVILIAGSLMRPRPAPKAPPVQPAQPPSRRGQMRQISDFLAERGTDAAKHVIYVPSAQASGVKWTDGRLVTTAAPPALATTASTITDAQPPVVTFAPQARFGQAGWVVVVARNAENQAITTSGILGGTADVKCGSTVLHKLVINTSFDAAFAGGGVFDLSGDLLGTVIQCGDTWTAVTYTSVNNLLGQQTGAEAVAWHDFGAHVREPSPEERHAMRLPGGGVFLSETRKKSRAFNIGLRPGDLIVRSGPDPVETIEDLLALGDEITVVREGRQIRLATDPSYTLDLPNAGAVLTYVQPGTRLFAAGLRSGDRIVRAAGLEDPGPTDLNRLIASSHPSWLVYERDDRRVWVLLK